MSDHTTFHVRSLLIQLNGFFVGEIDGELVSHVSAIAYPSHHTHIRKKGHGLKSVHKLFDVCNANYTIGCDINLDLRSKYKQLGFETRCNTNIAMLDLEKIVVNFENLGAQIPPDIAVKPVRNINLGKLLQYDGLQLVFGTMRQKFISS